MNEQLMSLALGFALGAVSKGITRFWNRKAPEVEAALNRADDVLEAKFNIDIPDAVQAGWHNFVHAGVAYANRFASDGRFWREVLRAIVLRDPAKAVLLNQELASLSWEKGIAAVEAMLSPELKALVNGVKEDLATKAIIANATTAGVLPEGAVETEVRAAIRAVAPAHKPVEGPVTKEVIEQLIRESQERQAKFGGAK